MFSNTHGTEGHRRTRSGRSSRRSSRIEVEGNTNDPSQLSRRSSRNDEERRSQRARQKLELRAKQQNNADEELTTTAAVAADDVYLNRMGHAGFSQNDKITSQDIPQISRALTAPIEETTQETAVSPRPYPHVPRKPAFKEWLGEQFPEAQYGDQLQQEIPSKVLPSGHGSAESTGSLGSAQHRWGRVFAERGTPLSRIGVEASRPILSSPGTPPLQRRAAVRRKRLHGSDTIINSPINLVELSANHRFAPPNTSSEGSNNNHNINSPDISPITPTDNYYWNTPNTSTPITSISTSQENKPLPLSSRLPLTPTMNSPLPIGPGPSTAGLPRRKEAPLQPSSSLSVPNSPAIGSTNLAHSPRIVPVVLNPSRRMDILQTELEYRPRSVSPMVVDHDYHTPRLNVNMRIDGTPPPPPLPPPPPPPPITNETVRYGSISPRLGQMRFSSPLPTNYSIPESDDPRVTPNKSSKRNKSVRLRCMMCTEKHKVDKMIQAPHCMHFLCTTCVTGLFHRALRTPQTDFPIQCCNTSIPLECLSTSGSGTLSILPHEFEEYKRLLQLLEDNDEDSGYRAEEIYCHVESCREVIPMQVGIGGGAGKARGHEKDKMRCGRCGSVTCGVCRRGWHQGPCTEWENI